MRTRLLGALGALATLGAAALVVSPGVADAATPLVSFLESRDPARLLLALGGIVGLYATWAALSGTPATPTTDEASARFARVGTPPESVNAGDRTLTGDGFDDRIGATCAGDGRALRRVRSTLADTAADAYARADDCDRERAGEAVRTGAWTDDRIAAAFLADETGPGFPLSARLRAWLDPEAERRRRVDRTVAAVRRALDGDGGSAAGATDDGGDR